MCKLWLKETATNSMRRKPLERERVRGWPPRYRFSVNKLAVRRIRRRKSYWREAGCPTPAFGASLGDTLPQPRRPSAIPRISLVVCFKLQTSSHQPGERLISPRLRAFAAADRSLTLSALTRQYSVAVFARGSRPATGDSDCELGVLEGELQKIEVHHPSR
jgi:hypothetical protein